MASSTYILKEERKGKNRKEEKRNRYNSSFLLSTLLPAVPYDKRERRGRRKCEEGHT